LIDTLMSEYSMTRAEVRRTPIAEALALRTVIALRHGYTWAEPSYAQRDVK
jgi:hypothetical protein